ncbi:MAG: NAD-dependent epimerase/dehydratase family protein [Acidobacteria bacterium]|nr:MAG: NAD-dependent epimerase/dehydratase family protein [Acidobacteriota bacterium]REK01868.1 MAG: NAD-dependent epimerase/dehydratase family protein [Acidobacteriota bacterium]REK14824.1 MAG: NAD-dependent epimerase/dehydratase family protein [Acidobacteriota bacterium]REK45539.1 MAG: NAD-dependent epimerase/dehydratase family protein [Acidobacteriota bacterium]
MPEFTKCLVTGGAGFIGSNLADELIRQGRDVKIIDDLSTGFRENLMEISGQFEFIEGDLNDPKALEEAVSDVEVVFHQAALPSVPRSVEDPVATHEACATATLKLLTMAKDLGVRRFVYAASSSAYGDQPVLPKVETMASDPLSPYAAAKLMGEHYCTVFNRIYGLETISLRYFNVFGPRQNPSSMYSGVISRFIDALMKDDTPVIYGDGEQSRDFTYIANVVNANIRAAEVSEGFGQSYNAANGERTTLNELLEVLKKITGKEGVQADFQPPRKGDVLHSQADNSKAVRTLGYENLVGLEEGLQKTIEWWKASRFSS